MLEGNVVRDKKGKLVSVNKRPIPKHLETTRIPPAWTDLEVDISPGAALICTGYDTKGRKQYLYSPDHVSWSKNKKFLKVRKLIEEHEDVRSQIEEDINDSSTPPDVLECALVAYLIYETGIRPGSNAETLGDVKAFGATTLQLRHIKPCARGVRLKFVGKKGVHQNVLVTNPYLVRELLLRKSLTTSYTTPVFDCPAHKLRAYVKTLGTEDYNPKDLRTMRGTLVAMDLMSWRKRIPPTKKARKEIVNSMLDKVAAQLGNTRAVVRSAYVDPDVYSDFVD